MRPALPRSPIPANLRRLRVAAGLTQAELAEEAEIANETVSRLERGRIEPSIDLLRRLARALRVSESELVARRASPKVSNLRVAERRLLALVRNWDDASIEELVRAVKLIVGAARRAEQKRQARR